MKLHELVDLKNRLLEFKHSETMFFNADLDKFTTLLNLIGVTSFPDNRNELYPTITTINHSYSDLKTKLDRFLETVDNRIHAITKDWYKMGYLTNTGAGCSQLDVLGERSLREGNTPYDVKSRIHGLISKYTNDAYPVLEIGPGDGVWTDYLVAGDPLYILDRHQEFLDSTKNKYPEQYKNRIRAYKVLHGDLPDSDCSVLPESQFNFIFSWNVFNYFPLDYTTAFLMSSFKLLRPGGVMVFSYNDCEDVHCAKFAEIGHASWMPKTVLKNKILELGFEIVNLDSENGWHWAEIRKPGELKTIKVHQSLGEIVRIPR